MISGMKTPPQTKPVRRAAKPAPVPQNFTVRDLNRRPGAILWACDENGAVRIRTRDGRAYSPRADAAGEAMAPAAARKAALDCLMAHRRMLRSLGAVSPGRDAVEFVRRTRKLAALEGLKTN